MKKLLRKLIRLMAAMPLIGRFVHIAAALYRIQALAQQVARIDSEVSTLRHLLASGYVPGGQPVEGPGLAFEDDVKNLVQSVPVALRRLRQDVDGLLLQAGSSTPAASASGPAGTPAPLREPASPGPAGTPAPLIREQVAPASVPASGPAGTPAPLIREQVAPASVPASGPAGTPAPLREQVAPASVPASGPAGPSGRPS
jgi:hypothetical protein